MDTKRVKSPEGVKALIRELWEKHSRGERIEDSPVYMIELPEPTEEEKRIMAVNRANRIQGIVDEYALQEALENAVRKLGGW